MSTKSGIRSGEGFYLYEECFEPDTVYLELDDVEWCEVLRDQKTRIRLRFTLEQAAELGLVSEEYVVKRRHNNENGKVF